MTDARFIYGTAGWSYPDWVGPFYPAGTPEKDFLARYAERFSAVEVDSTYYRIPTVKMTTNWARQTPDGFSFSPKMVGEITHERFLDGCDDLVAGFVHALAPLGDKLGPIVLQFPYFKKDTGVTLDSLLERLLPFLDTLPKEFRFAVEVRNKSFLKPALLDALRQRRTALVLVDHVWMPGPAEYSRIEGAFTADYVPIRLLGDRYGIEKLTQKWDQVVIDQGARLAAWAGLIRRALATKLDVQVFVNNHYAGHAPRSVLELADAVRDGLEGSDGP
jgi:uncharacterized protein YecE (DUF72 family)